MTGLKLLLYAHSTDEHLFIEFGRLPSGAIFWSGLSHPVSYVVRSLAHLREDENIEGSLSIVDVATAWANT